jgi:hypothetical protein
MRELQVNPLSNFSNSPKFLRKIVDWDHSAGRAGGDRTHECFGGMPENRQFGCPMSSRDALRLRSKSH